MGCLSKQAYKKAGGTWAIFQKSLKKVEATRADIRLNDY
jgi:hypothetical protein